MPLEGANKVIPKETIEIASAEQAAPPAAKLMDLVGGAFVSQAIYVAAKLGIADLLADGPRSAEFLAVATSTHERSLYRLLRSLTSVGVFTEVEPRIYGNSPMSETLRSDHPASTRDVAIWMNEEEHWRVYGHLLHSVKTGKPAWDVVHGEPIFPYLFSTNRELGDIFNRAMTSFSNQTIPAILDAYDFAAAETIADIGGGYGHLLGAILEANPQANGVLFDLSAVAAGAPAMFESYGVAERVSIVEGDFNHSIPVSADIYLLKHIIHDWYDETNENILRNIGAAMPENARVLIIDAVLPEDDLPHFGKLLDLEMLMSPGGVERTASEFQELLKNSGFRLSRIIPTSSPVSIVEAVKG